MNFFKQEKIKILFKEFTENKFFASVYFNVFCIIVYLQNYNWLLNYTIITYVSLIMSSEIYNFVNKLKQDQYTRKHLEYILAEYDCERALTSNFIRK